MIHSGLKVMPLLLVLGLSLGLATAVAQDTGNEKQVVVALDSDAPNHDPHMHTERFGIIMNSHVFDSLMMRDAETMEPVYNLVESHEVIDDTIWEFKLREDVDFHNGEHFDAEAVKFSMERVLNPDQASPQRGNISFIAEVEVVDEYTVRLHTEHPAPLMLERLTFLAMIPPQYAQEVGDDGLAMRPVGTGPYQFVEWRPGERTIMEAYDNYHRGRAAVDQVTFRIIPEKATQLAELRAGGVDLVRLVPPDLQEDVERRGNARTDLAGILRTWFVGMNTSRPPFDDIRVRQAVAHAIDMEGIVEGIFLDEAFPVPALVHPNQFGHNPDLTWNEYNPERAQELLTEAGAENTAITFYYYQPGAGHQVADTIVANLNAVGFNASSRFMDVSSYVQENRAGNFDIFKGSWGSFSVFDADAVLHPQLHQGGAYGHLHQLPDSQFNEWIEEARNTLDEDQRRELYFLVQEELLRTVPIVSMFAPYDIYGLSNRLEYTPRADELIYIYEADVSD